MARLVKRYILLAALGLVGLVFLVLKHNAPAPGREARWIEYDSKTFPKYTDVEVPSGWRTHDWSGGKPSGSEEEKFDASIKEYTFNAYRSNQISLRRPLLDYRSAECSALVYPPKLPTASVVICFINEMWSAVFRTVWSILDRTPAGLLTEIILVDDHSDAHWLGKDLESYVASLPSHVKLLQSESRLGLIRARMLGAKHATGDVLIFLDAHCEATTGWIEPILARIGGDPHTVVCPTIDSINDRSLEFFGGGGGAVGGFHWTLDFTWEYAHERRKVSDPVPSATMAGGLFAIDREYWFALGEYDTDMRGWGGENLELSFRIWMCGGRMDFLPCSHVGHIFRGSHPYNVPGGFNENFIRNSARLAEVWMDEYKEAYYFVRPQAAKMDIGDLQVRKDLRKQLQCKSFKWFLDKFFPGKFVPMPQQAQASGQIRQQHGHQQCVDTYGHQHVGERLGLYSCHPRDTPSQNQAFIFTTSGQIRIIWDMCLDAQNGQVVLYQCNSEALWTHDGKGRLVHRGGQCLDTKGSDVIAAPCSDSPSQKWGFSGYLNG